MPDAWHGRLLGIDPGLRFTGWGLVEADGNRLRHVADGVIATDGATSVPERLRALHDALAALLARAPAGRGGGRGNLRQPQRRRDAEARLRARRGAAGAGAGRHSGRRIWRQVGEAGGGRHRRGGQGAGGRMMVRRLLPGARADAAPTPRTRWRWRSATRITARARLRVGRRGAHGVIAKLTGRVEALEDGRCVLDVNGVGYLVQASTRTLAALPAGGAGIAADRDACARGRHPALRLRRTGRARLVPAADHGAGRGRRRWRWACCRRCRRAT